MFEGAALGVDSAGPDVRSAPVPIGDRAWPRGERVNRGYLRHALAVRLLALGQPRVEASRRGLDRLPGRLPKIVEPHRDPFAVEAQDEQVVSDLGFAQLGNRCVNPT